MFSPPGALKRREAALEIRLTHLPHPTPSRFDGDQFRFRRIAIGGRIVPLRFHLNRA